MRVVFLGPPGAGKGTQASLLAERLQVPHLSSGELLRAAAASRSDAGQRAAFYFNAGKLVPDDITVRLVAERLAAKDCSAGFLLDGFPRTYCQAEELEKLLSTPLHTVLSLHVNDEVVIRRLEKRGRQDDESAIVLERLRQFESQTKPLIDRYEQAGLLEEINGNGTIEQVAARIDAAIDRHRPD